MILPYITHNIEVWRKEKINNISNFALIESGINTNIQPLAESNLLFDIELTQFLWLLFSDNENLIKENDKIIDNKWNSYIVQWLKYFIWPIENSFELILIKK